MMYFKFSIECIKLNSNCRTDYTTRRINTYLPFPFSPAVLRQCLPSSMVVPCPWWPVGWWLVSEAVMAMAEGTVDGCLCGLCQCAGNHAGIGTRAALRWNCWLSKGPDCLTSTNLIQLGLLYCYKAQTWPKPKAGNVSLAVIVYLRTSDLSVECSTGRGGEQSPTHGGRGVSPAGRSGSRLALPYWRIRSCLVKKRSPTASSIGYHPNIDILYSGFLASQRWGTTMAL
jgi:hypothetical protein